MGQIARSTTVGLQAVGKLGDVCRIAGLILKYVVTDRDLNPACHVIAGRSAAPCTVIYVQSKKGTNGRLPHMLCTFA